MIIVYFFCQMSDVVTWDISKFIYADRPVSKYVFKMFDLEVGPQSRLIVVPRVGGFSGVTSQDKSDQCCTLLGL